MENELIITSEIVQYGDNYKFVYFEYPVFKSGDIGTGAMICKTGRFITWECQLPTA